MIWFIIYLETHNNSLRRSGYEIEYNEDDYKHICYGRNPVSFPLFDSTRMTGESKVYETYDLYVAAFLATKNRELIRMERSGTQSTRYVFCFNDSKLDCKKLTSDYHQGDKIEAKLFAQNINRFKNSVRHSFTNLASASIPVPATSHSEKNKGE